MASEELLQLILHGNEERGLEYKSSMPWSNLDLRAKVAKTAMAMANLQDGGAIVIGVDKQRDDSYVPNGMHPDDIHSYNHDDVSEFVNEHAAPFVEVSVDKVDHEGKSFVVVQIKEFALLPVVCRKNGREGLRRGAFYIRGRRKHETVEVSNEAEMSEIIERAVDKGIRHQQARRRAVGWTETEEQESTERFHQQAGDL